MIILCFHLSSIELNSLLGRAALDEVGCESDLVAANDVGPVGIYHGGVADVADGEDDLVDYNLRIREDDGIVSRQQEAVADQSEGIESGSQINDIPRGTDAAGSDEGVVDKSDVGVTSSGSIDVTMVAGDVDKVLLHDGVDEAWVGVDEAGTGSRDGCFGNDRIVCDHCSGDGTGLIGADKQKGLSSQNLEIWWLTGLMLPLTKTALFLVICNPLMGVVTKTMVLA